VLRYKKIVAFLNPLTTKTIATTYSRNEWFISCPYILVLSWVRTM